MLFSVAVGISGVSSSSVPPYICGGSYLSVGRGMRAMGGAVKPPARCCSKSHRICQIRPSMKPIAIAIEISKAISSTKVIDMFLSGQCARLREKVTGPFLRGDFGKKSRSRGDRYHDASLFLFSLFFFCYLSYFLVTSSFMLGSFDEDGAPAAAAGADRAVFADGVACRSLVGGWLFFLPASRGGFASPGAACGPLRFFRRGAAGPTGRTALPSLWSPPPGLPLRAVAGGRLRVVSAVWRLLRARSSSPGAFLVWASAKFVAGRRRGRALWRRPDASSSVSSEPSFQALGARGFALLFSTRLQSCCGWSCTRVCGNATMMGRLPPPWLNKSLMQS